MENIKTELLALFHNWLPTSFVVVITCCIFVFYKKFFLEASNYDSSKKGFRQFILFMIALCGLIGVLLFLPIPDATREQLFSLLGIALTATIALSSTTFVGNAMSGLMLKSIDAIKLGDFLTVAGHNGRVTELGILHVEIQGEDRGLTTLPNLLLVTNPINIVRSSGTIISATCSLGYDVSRNKIEKHLITAAEKVGLTNPFVQILELGDFSISYRVGGFLEEVKYLISMRSKLRGAILDILHENNVEIVSPHFMNQRVLPADKIFIPKKETVQEVSKDKSPEDVMFDKADEAASIGDLQARIASYAEEIEEIEDQMKESEDKASFKEEKERIKKRIDLLKMLIKKKEKKL